MFSRVKRRAALTVAAGVLGMAGTAVAASPALAYHINYSSTGAAVPVGTSYTATSGTIALTNSSGGTIASCPSSSLSGVTTGSGGISSGLNVTSGTFNPTCKNASTGATLVVSGNFATPWQLTPTGGGPTTFTGTISNVSVTLACGSNSETFTGTLGSGASENNVTSGSNITLSNAQSLSETSHTGTGCGLPGPYGATGTYTLTKVGGSAVSSTNNLWLFSN